MGAKARSLAFVLQSAEGGGHERVDFGLLAPEALDPVGGAPLGVL